MNKPVKYVATISPVKEVALLGTADLSYWRARLQAAGLVPAEIDRRARVLICGVSSQFMGLRFCELSISVVVNTPNENGGRNAAFLTHAYNSSRLLAWCERVFFATPYSPADIRVVTEAGAFIRLVRGEVTFTAEVAASTAAGTRAPARFTHETWEGPIYLPVDNSRLAAGGNVFFARLSGETRIFPFDPALDRVAIQPAQEPALQALVDSGFAGHEWQIRENATHARSKTYRRSQMPDV